MFLQIEGIVRCYYLKLQYIHHHVLTLKELLKITKVEDTRLVQEGQLALYANVVLEMIGDIVLVKGHLPTLLIIFIFLLQRPMDGVEVIPAITSIAYDMLVHCKEEGF